MKHFVLLAFFIAFTLQAEEVAENGDFAKGLTHWSSEGKVEPGNNVLLITLNERKWTLVEQDIKLSKEPPSAFTLKVELAAGADFKPAEKSKKYAEEDFAMGGSYGWSARIFPRADFLIQFSNSGGWEYRPVQLKADGSSTTVVKKFEKLKEKKGTLTLAFPPGAGTVVLKLVSVDLQAPAPK